jgi:hypothetical protein
LARLVSLMHMRSSSSSVAAFRFALGVADMVAAGWLVSSMFF